METHRFHTHTHTHTPKPNASYAQGTEMSSPTEKLMKLFTCADVWHARAVQAGHCNKSKVGFCNDKHFCIVFCNHIFLGIIDETICRNMRCDRLT